MHRRLQAPLAPQPTAVHEFKNHLSVILGFCDLVLTEVPEGQLRSDLSEIKKAASAALSLLPDITPPSV
jgi:hypothetical protein